MERYVFSQNSKQPFACLFDIPQITFEPIPTIPKLHRRWNYFPPLASDGLILVIWRFPEAHSTNIVVIQTRHPLVGHFVRNRKQDKKGALAIWQVLKP